jgi:hypothetical protein
LGRSLCDLRLSARIASSTNERNGTFKDITESAIGFDTKKGMNAFIADYDNDGKLDRTGANAVGWFLGALFADFDNDGWQDIYAADGWVKNDSFTPITMAGTISMWPATSARIAFFHDVLRMPGPLLNFWHVPFLINLSLYWHDVLSCHQCRRSSR